MDDMQKYHVISRLQQKIEAKDIADDLGVSYGGVLKLRREFEEAQLNGTVDLLLNMDNVIIDEVAEKLDNIPGVKEIAADLTKGLAGLERLSFELQTTAGEINKRALVLILGANTAVDLETLTDVICKLQVAFVNKNMTQVNVQNNFDTSSKYGSFLGDKPSD